MGYENIINGNLTIIYNKYYIYIILNSAFDTAINSWSKYVLYQLPEGVRPMYTTKVCGFVNGNAHEFGKGAFSLSASGEIAIEAWEDTLQNCLPLSPIIVPRNTLLE